METKLNILNVPKILESVKEDLKDDLDLNDTGEVQGFARAPA